MSAHHSFQSIRLTIATVATRLCTTMLVIAAVFSATFFTDAAIAQVPRTISYQGVITGGTAPIDGQHQIHLVLYDSAVGGNDLFEESHIVNVASGVFAVEIGSINPFPQALIFDKPFYLGISIDGGVELAPRIALASAPYALNAHRAELAEGLVAGARGVVTSINELSGPIHILGDSVTTVTQTATDITIHAQPGKGIQAVTSPDHTLAIANGTGPIVSAGLADASVTPQKLAQAGATPGQILKWNGTAWALASDNGTTYIAGQGITIAGNTIAATGGLPAGTTLNSTLRWNGAAWAENSNMLSDANGNTRINGDVQTHGATTLGDGTGADNIHLRPGTGNIQVDGFTQGVVKSSPTGLLTTGPVDLAQDVTGVLQVPHGGTGLAAIPIDQILIGNGTSPLKTATLAAGAGITITQAAGAITIANTGAFGWALTGNANTTPATNFLGTTDNQPFEVHVYDGDGPGKGSRRVWRAEPNQASANIIGGYQGNTVTAGVLGATIAGGGINPYVNQITDDFSVIGGGTNNRAGDNAGTTNDASYATVAGGGGNVASGNYSTIAGGANNTASGQSTNVTGGANNTASGRYASVGGGTSNFAIGNGSTVAGGGYFSTAGIGYVGNAAIGNASTIAGGIGNYANGDYSTVLGGTKNGAMGARSAIAGGGWLSLLGSGSFGFNNGTSATDSASVAAPGTAYLGNVNLWLGNTNNTAGQLRLYEAQSGGVNFPNAATNYSSFQSGNQSADIQYVLPTSVPSANQVLAATSIAGTTPYSVTLDWVTNSGGGSGVIYGPTSTQSTLTSRTTPLYDIAYVSTAPDANSTGAIITSSAGTAGNNSATGLTVTAHATGSGIAEAIDATGRVNIDGYSSYDISHTPWLWSGPSHDGSVTMVGGTMNSTNTGDRNTFVGSLAGQSNTTGFRNTFVGELAGQDNTSGFRNTFVGHVAGAHNTTGYYNAYFGHGAGSTNTTGNDNAAFGYSAGNAISGTGNSLFGSGAGQNVTSGQGLTLIGNGTTAGNGLNSATAIGSGAEVDANNSLVLGIIGTKVGIGTTTPIERLNVENGNMLLSRTGTTGAGQLQLQGTGTGLSTFAAGAQGTSNINYVLPTAIGTANQVLAISSVSGTTANLGWTSASGNTAWNLTGNSGTTAGTNFIGTTDNHALDIRSNNVIQLRINTDSSIQRDAGGNARGEYSVDLQISRNADSLVASGLGATIAGGAGNRASGTGSFAAGWYNAATAPNATVFGSDNQAIEQASVVSGGVRNMASGMYGTVAGGWKNSATGGIATVSGGDNNTNAGSEATIAGGEFNTISPSEFGAIGGGDKNHLYGYASVIPGGVGLSLGDSSFGVNQGLVSRAPDLSSFSNLAFFGNMDLWIGNSDSVARGIRLYSPASGAYTTRKYSSFTSGTQTSTINYTIPTTQPLANQVLTATTVTGSGPYAAALGWTNGNSFAWGLTGNSGTTAGTNFIGTTDNQPFEIHIFEGDFFYRGSKRVMRFEPTSTSPNIIAGYFGNSVTSGVSGATISGGGSSGDENQVAGDYGTVAGGRDNRVTGGTFATVSGGGYNSISGSSNYAVLAGGNTNQITTGINSVISGGASNVVSAANGVISGGMANWTAGAISAIPGGDSLKLGGSSFGMSVPSNGSTASITDLSSFSNLAYFGNMDLWLGNTDNAARGLRFYAPGSSVAYGTRPFSSFLAGSQTSTINYTLPTSQPSANQVLTASSITGSGPYNVTLGWASASGSGTGVIYGPTSVQATLTPRTTALFNVAYIASAPDAAATGAIITSSAGAAGNNDATGLTVTAHATGAGVAKAIEATGRINIDVPSSYDIGSNRWLWMGPSQDNSVTMVGNTGNTTNTGTNNTFVGGSAGTSNTTGNYNTFVGESAGLHNTGGYSNTMIGKSAGPMNTSGWENTFVGAYAGSVNTTGTDNTFVGVNVGEANSTGGSNTFVGSQSGLANTTGFGNSFYGMGSGQANSTGISNTVNGYQSFEGNSTGSYNTAMGVQALFSNTVASGNTAVGYWALQANTYGTHGVAIGYQALASNTTGIANVANGYQTLYSNTTGWANTASGDSAMFYNTTGGWSIAYGNDALYFNTTGSFNAGAGNYALEYNTTGSFNTAFGDSALLTNTTGNSNTALGNHAYVSTGTLSNATAIGSNAMVGQSNSLVLGSINGVNSATTDVKVGIGTTTPLQKLNVENGSLLLSRTGATAADTLLLQGTSTGKTGFIAGAQGATNINYVLPSTIGNANDVLAVASMSGTTAVLGWSSGSGSGVIYGPTSVQATLTPRTTPLFNVAYSASATDANAAGASITSSAGVAGNYNATALTVVAQATGSGIARALDATGRVSIDAASSYDIASNRWLWSGPSQDNSVTMVGYTNNTTNTGHDNTFVGMSAGASNTSGGDNTYIGRLAGVSSTTAGANTFVGSGAGALATTGYSNSFFGFQAGQGYSTGYQNTALGYQAGGSGSGNTNTAIGANAGNGGAGSGNVYVGVQAGFAATSGGNVMIGTIAGSQTTTGSSNTYVGNGAGYSNITGFGQTLIGQSANVVGTALTNATAIGYASTVAASNSMVLGSIGGTADTKVGIGTTTPQQKLSVENGNVLVSRTGANASGQLQLQGTGTGITTLAAGAQSSTNINYTLPTAAPVANGNLLLATSGTSSSMSWSTGLVWDNTNTRLGVNTTTPLHPIHSVNTATTDESAAVYANTSATTSNQSIGLWGDASNTGTSNTGTIGVLATGNGNTTAAQTNVALQVNDGELTMGRTTEAPSVGSTIEAATGGTAYSAEGPSGIVELTLGATGNLVTAAPTAGAIQDLGSVTINNRYVQTGSIVLVNVVGFIDDGTAPNPRDAAFIVNADNTTAGSFVVRVKMIPTVTNATNHTTSDKVRIGYIVVNKSR